MIRWDVASVTTYTVVAADDSARCCWRYDNDDMIYDKSCRNASQETSATTVVAEVYDYS